MTWRGFRNGVVRFLRKLCHYTTDERMSIFDMMSVVLVTKALLVDKDLAYAIIVVIVVSLAAVILKMVAYDH